MALPLPAVKASTSSPSADEIVSRSLAAFYYAGDDGRVQITMQLINSAGKVRRRELIMLRKDLEGENQRYMIYFQSPADIKGTAFLIWKYPEQEDDRWIFIPAVNLVRRIAADDKRSSFVGSDFTYEDVSGRDVNDETHRLLRTDTMDGRSAYVIESQPKIASDYIRRLTWIDQERWLPLREEYFDAQDERVKVFTADEVEEIDGYWTMVKRTMKNVKTNHKTEVVFEGVSYDLGLPEDVFTERYLRQPPRRWVQ